MLILPVTVLLHALSLDLVFSKDEALESASKLNEDEVLMFYVARLRPGSNAKIANALGFSAWGAVVGLLVCSGGSPSSLAATSDDAAPSSGSAVCARMADAMLKTAKTPYSSISIITVGSSGLADKGTQKSSRTSETIFTGRGLFVRTGGGSWRKIDADISALQELVRKASSKLERCQDLGSEKLGGASMSVLSADEGTKGIGAATKQWVEKDRGVLIRSESDSKTKDGLRHAVIEYRYGNITAPQL